MIIHLLIYLLLLGGVLAFNIVNNGYLPFVLDIIFISITVILAIVVILQIKSVEARFESELTTVERGNKAGIKIIIKNKGFLAITTCKIYVTIEYDNKKRTYKTISFIAPHSETIAEILVPCRDCDCAKLQINKLYVYDYLKLFELGKKNKVESYLLVIPNSPNIDFISSTNQNLTNEENIIYSDKKPGDDPTEIFAIREFQAGDKIRNIHWKVSSKVNEYMVKDYGLPVFEDDTIIFEWVCNKGKDNKHIQNQTYDLLFGLMVSMLRRGFGFNVCYVSDTYHQIRINNMSDIYNFFFEIYSNKKNKESCSEIYYSNHGKSSNRIIFVSNEYNEAAALKMKLLMEIGPVFYLIPKDTGGQDRVTVYNSK